MKYESILRFSVDLFSVDRLQSNSFVKKFQLSIHLRVKELSPYIVVVKMVCEYSPVQSFCINGMDVTNRLKVRVKADWKFIIEKIL